MNKIALLLPAIVGFSFPAMAQDNGQPSAPVEQASPEHTPSQAAAAASQSPDASTLDPTKTKLQALPTACASTGSMQGSEQGRSVVDTNGLQNQGSGNEQLISLVSAMQLQMKQALGNNNVDLALACTLLATYNGLVQIAGVEAQFGKDDTIKSAAQAAASAAQQNAGTVSDWLGKQQPPATTNP
jgi:hypothetical protein